MNLADEPPTLSTDRVLVGLKKRQIEDCIRNDKEVEKKGEGWLSSGDFLFTDNTGQRFLVDHHQSKHSRNWPRRYFGKRRSCFPLQFSLQQHEAAAKLIAH
jgi:hypothetical protein